MTSDTRSTTPYGLTYSTIHSIIEVGPYIDSFAWNSNKTIDKFDGDAWYISIIEFKLN